MKHNNVITNSTKILIRVNENGKLIYFLFLAS